MSNWQIRDLANGELVQTFSHTEAGLIFALQAAKVLARECATNVMIESDEDGLVSDYLVVCHPMSYAE